MNPLNSPERLSYLFINQVKDYAIFTTDTNGIITSWNEGAERVKGYKAEEIIGQYYGILHPDEYQQEGRPQKELEIALEKGVFEDEDWRKRKDGTLFWATVTLTSIFSEQGEHIGYTKVTGDLTKQKELQDKLAERQQTALDHKNKELHQVNLDLDTFIYTASHDLRSPITNIEGLVAYLKAELTEMNCINEETEEILNRIISSVNSFKQTIEDLTEITRLQKNLSEGASEEIINIQEVYEEILKDLGNPGEEDGVFFSADFEVHQIKFSKKHFKSVLYNLINNSLKYRAPDRKCIINIHTRLEEPYVLLSVKDNGLGIKERYHEQLFSMFKRFHDHVEGTGVGLFMVKRIVENAGGKIELESEEGVGTEFKLFLMAAV